MCQLGLVAGATCSIGVHHASSVSFKSAEHLGRPVPSGGRTNSTEEGSLGDGVCGLACSVSESAGLDGGGVGYGTISLPSRALVLLGDGLVSRRETAARRICSTRSRVRVRRARSPGNGTAAGPVGVSSSVRRVRIEMPSCSSWSCSCSWSWSWSWSSG
jgi:hypothetical protein